MAAPPVERDRGVTPGPKVEGSGEVLSLIRGGRARTISELAAAMDMARSTVGQRVDRLVAAGLVVSELAAASDGPGVRGRPAAVLAFNPEAGVVLVAHLGLTGARVAVTDLGGAVLASQFQGFALDETPAAVIEQVERGLTAVLEASGRSRTDLRGVGIGLPSALELAITRLPTVDLDVPWQSHSITDRLTKTFGVPAFADNDVNLLALGEHRTRWSETDVLLCVKVGTVIGCGTVIRGEVVTGAQGIAGGIGHLPVPGDTTPCSCGNIGCLDAVASGRALATRLRHAGFPVADAHDVAVLARAGVPEPAEAVRMAGRAIGEVLAHAVNLLNPGVIAVWGYLAEAEDQLLAGIRQSVYQRSLPAATRSLQLVRAQLGDGLAGVALMVISRVLAPKALDQHLSWSPEGPRTPTRRLRAPERDQRVDPGGLTDTG